MAAQATPPSAKEPATILYDETDYRIAADGTARYTHRVVYRIDQANPPESWAEASVNWEPWYQKLATVRARVLLPGGTFVELDPKTVTDAPRTSDEAETFTSGRVRKAPIPGITLGAIVEEVDEVEDKRAFSHAGMTRTHRFQSSVPVAFEKLLVETPQGVPYHDRLDFLDARAARVQENNGAIEHVYTRAAVPARVAGDIALAIAEDTTPLVAFGTGTEWAAAAKEYAGIAEPVLAAGAPLAGVVPATGGDRAATIRAVVQRLQHEVRYTGVEFDEASFVPGAPAETLKRHYGDCKDKSALLVTWLRQAGVPANLALLKTGPGQDVQRAMPSLDQFDHAIVYVPAAAGAPALWIDATATYNTVGTLPYMDAGREALIIAPETTALTRTPDATPDDSVMTETTEFQLPPFGKASATETTQSYGYTDASLRSQFGGVLNEDARKGLANYAQTVYLSKELKGTDHTDGSDLLTPFRLTLTMQEAGRGETTLQDAAAAFSPAATWNQLPRWFGQEEPKPTDPEEKAQLEKSVAARATAYAVQPFRMEKRVLVHLPAGFTPRTLPADKETAVGPGKLLEHYTLENPSLLKATVSFSTGKAVLTVAEALQMRDAVLALGKRDLVLLGSDEAGVHLLLDKQPRQAVTLERAAIQASPGKALPHLHLSRLLLNAGAVDPAVAEAKTAVSLEPSSFEAHQFLAFALTHNTAGVRYAPGFHRDEAIAEYRKALALKPDAAETQFELAITEEFDARGVRYADRAEVQEAVRDYRTVIQKNPQANGLAQYQDNLLYALFSSGQYAEVTSTAAALPPTNVRRSFLLAADLAQHGTSGGVEAVKQSNSNAESRVYVYTTASNLLTRAGKYPEAVLLMQAAMQEGGDANGIARSVELFSHLKRVSIDMPSGAAPADPVRGMLLAALSDRLNDATVRALLSHDGYRTETAYQHSLQQGQRTSGLIQKMANRTGMAEAVLTDMLVSNLKVTATGEDTTGYVVTAEMIGTGPQSFFVVREGDRYRIVASSTDDREVGAYALTALGRGNTESVRAILNWKRDHLRRSDADDVFAGPLFGRFWKASTAAADATPESMRLAALALLAQTADAKPLLPEAVAARKNFDEKQPRAEQRRDNLDLLLARMALASGDAAVALPAVQELLTEEPDSPTAILLAGETYRLQQNYTAWDALLQARLQKKPNDPDLLRQRFELHASQQNWAEARADEKQVIDNGRAVEGDYNNFAWTGTFNGDLGEATMAAITQANALSSNNSFASLHTLATIYALQGRTVEAHATLLQAMNAGGLPAMNEACWLVEGLIEKQLGLPDANATLKRVKLDPEEEGPLTSPTSSWVLAQRQMLVK